MQVEQLVVGRGGVDLEIAGVDDDAERGSDGERYGADDGVGDVDELDFERSDFDDLLGLDLDEARLLLELVLFEAALYQGDGEGSAIDGDVDLGEEVWDGADVVFVAVGEHESTDLGDVVFEEGEVGHHQVDAEEFGVGEHHAGIDDDHIVAEADDGHVHTELAKTAEGNHL